MLNSQVNQYRDSDGDAMFQAAIDSRYTVNGIEYATPASANYATSRYSDMKKTVEIYAPGTPHPIRYNSAHPDDVRFDVGYNLGFFLIPVILGGMGVVFAGIGVGVSVAFRSAQRTLCPSCGEIVQSRRDVCPRCGASLR